VFLFYYLPVRVRPQSIHPKHPHYLARTFAVAADFAWSPDGSQMMGLVITNRPDTRKCGSGIIVLIDPVY